VKGDWFWSFDRNEDDPAFMKTELSVPRSHREIVEDLLSQLTEQEEEEGRSREEADSGAQGNSQILDDDEGETASAANGELESAGNSRDQLVCSYLK
jgi:hypothetical protein